MKPAILIILSAAAILIAAGDPAVDSDMQFRIAFVDNPPYISSWWPWSDDHFRVRAEIRNVSEQVYAIEEYGPCYDCNPKFFVRSAATGEEPPRGRELDVLYVLTDSRFIDLAPGESYVDTIDIAEFVEFELERGETYRVWFEYRTWPNYQFHDTLRKTPIWREPLVSDTLAFVY